MIDQVEIRDGWWWPKTDVTCWRYMNKYPDVPKLVANFLNPSDRKVIVQAGGNCGFYPKQYSKLFDTVYTFEPEWLNFYCLTHNVPEPNVIKTQSCLGDAHQLVGLHIKEKNRGKNFVNSKGICPVFKIDNLGLEECSAIHLDIEGYEYYALRGAIETIKKCKPLIVIEVWEMLDSRFEENINVKTNQLLTELGYKYVQTLYESDFVYQYQGL